MHAAAAPAPTPPEPTPVGRGATAWDLRALAIFVATSAAVVAALWLVARTGLVDLVRWDEGGPQLAPPPGYRGPPSLQFVLRPAHLVVLAWAGLVARCLPRDRLALGAALVALVARVALSPKTILMGVDYAYMRMSDGTGLQYTGKLYGPTWTSLLGAVWWLSGAWPGHVGLANLALSATTAGLGVAIAGATSGRGAARAAAVLLPLLPLPVALARTETELVLVAALQATAWWGLLAGRREGAWLAAASAALLAHLRPEQMAAAVVVAAALAAGRRPVPAAVAAGGVATRLVAIATGFSAVSLASPAGVQEGVPFAPAEWLGVGGTFAELDPTVTPLALAPLVALAVARRRREALVALALVAASTVPVLHLHRPTDVLRFSLPAQTAWAVLAAAGLAALPRRAAVAALLVTAAAAWPARHPLRPPFPWQVEHAVLADLLATTPPTTTVWYAAPWDRTGALRAWLDERGAASWRELGDATPGAGDLLLVGRAGVPAAALAACPTPVSTAEAATRAQDVERGLPSVTRVEVRRCAATP